MWQHKSQPAAQIFWGNSLAPRSNSSSRVVQDKTWGLTFHHYSPVNTDFSVKAGSKRMILSTTSDSSTSSSATSSSPTKGGKMTEDLLLKKYRQDFFSTGKKHSEIYLNFDFFLTAIYFFQRFVSRLKSLFLHHRPGQSQDLESNNHRSLGRAHGLRIFWSKS